TAEAKSNHGNGNGAAHGNEHHSQAADSSPVADSGGVEHGNSDHSASAKGAKAGEGVATGGNTDHGNSKHAAEPGSAQAAATETAEAKSKPENGVGNDTKHHSQADDPPGAAKTAEPGGAEHGNSQHASEPATAKEVATEKAEAKSKPDGSVGHDNEHQSQAADAASPAGRTAEPAAAIKPEAQPIKMGTETGGADRDMAFRFDSGAASSTLVAAAGPVEPNGPHNPHVQKAGLDVIVQTLSETIHEPTAHHGNHDFHPGIVPAPHDLLI
ncbi:hypothetical protein IVB31_24045, partial [Bradyrhizobium sp. 21]|nr:hypothetical protein [Bradyrhizobium sp. 21]